MGQNIITLAKFISRYLGVSGLNLKKLSHEDVKHLIPNLKRSTFALINSHPEEINSGNIVLVTDGKKVIPYYIPAITNNNLNQVIIEEDRIKAQKTIPNYSDMKIYELKELLNVKFNGRSVSRHARNELEDRGVVLRKKYNRQEFKKWRCEYERN